MAPDTALPSPSVSLTSAAAGYIKKLIDSSGEGDKTMLRLSIMGGGCSGYSYHFGFDAEATSEDRVFEKEGARLVVDENSLALLAGAEIDYVEDLMGASLEIRNPQAKSSCGCGSSFSV